MNKIKNLINKLLSWLHKAEVCVSNEFISLVGEDAAKQFGTATLALLKTTAGMIVTQTVASVELLNPSLSKEQKIEIVSVQAGTLLASEGKVVGKNLLRMLVELAVATYKNKHISE